MVFGGYLGDFEGFLKRSSAFSVFLCIHPEERQPLLAMKRSWSSSDDSVHRAPDDLAALATATPLRPNALSVAASVFDDTHAVDDEGSGAASGAEPVQQSLAPLPEQCGNQRIVRRIESSTGCPAWCPLTDCMGGSS